MNDELQEFIEEQNKHIRGLYPHLEDNEKYVYAQSIKLSEEVGEFSEAVLNHFNTQRKSKADKNISIEKEVADVLITTLLVAKSLDLDTNTILQKRIAEITARRNTD